MIFDILYFSIIFKLQSHTFQPSTFDKTELQAVSEHGIVNGDANHLKVADANSGGSCQSPSSQDLSDVRLITIIVFNIYN